VSHKQQEYFREHTHGRSSDNFTIGKGKAGVDYALIFDGESHDGTFTWMEDEDYLKSSDDVLFDSSERVYFRDTALGVYSAADGYLDLFADTDVRVNTYPIRPVPVGGLHVNFGEDPASELGYGSWADEANVSLIVYSLDIGNGEDGYNSYFTMRGFHGNGVFEWIDAEQQFRVYNNLLMWGPASLMLSDTHSYITDDGSVMTISTDSVLYVGCTELQVTGDIKLGDVATRQIGLWGAGPVTQPTTAVTEAVFAENAGGTAVNDDSTFDGYTLRQVVKALRSIGILE